jgi:hypothetical protein
MTMVYTCLNLHRNWKTEGFLIRIRKTGLLLDNTVNKPIIEQTKLLYVQALSYAELKWNKHIRLLC